MEDYTIDDSAWASDCVEANKIQLVHDGLHGKKGFSQDANEGIAFERSLEYISQVFYEIKKRPLHYADVFDIDTSVPDGAATYNYRLNDVFGEMKFISESPDDIPVADISATEHISNIGYAAVKMTYSVEELRKAAFMNYPVLAQKTRAISRTAEEFLNKICFSGDSTRGINGLLTDSNIIRIDALIGSNGANDAEKKSWVKKSTGNPLELVSDITSTRSSITETTKMIEIPDVILLPFAQYNTLHETVLPNTGKTIYEHITDSARAQGINLTIMPIEDLNGAGDGGQDIMVMYHKSPENAQFLIPLPKQLGILQYHNLKYEVPMEVKTGGLIIRYPGAFRIMQGI